MVVPESESLLVLRCPLLVLLCVTEFLCFVCTAYLTVC